MIAVRGHGHPAVRASHAKTLEFTSASDLGSGGTCVVAVESVVHGEPLAGAVRGELRVGGHAVSFAAIGNPDWDPSGPVILRRSAVRKPDTIATHATISAADLPGAVVESLRDTAAAVTLTLERLSPQPARLVLGLDPSAAERNAADVITNESPIEVVNRVLLLGAPSAELLARTPQPVEVLDRAALAAVVAASPYATGATSRTLADRERAVVLRVAIGDLAKTIRSAQRRGRRTGAILGRLPWVHWGELGSLPIPDGVRSVWLCLDPVPAFDLDARIEELRDAGIAVKQIAKQLSAELGVSAKEVYERATGRR